MGLRREVHDRIRLGGQLLDGYGITDVAPDKPEPGVLGHFGQVFLAASVGEFIQHGDLDLLVSPKPLPHER